MDNFRARTTVNDPTPMQNNAWWYSNSNPFYAVESGGYHPLGLPNCTCYAYGRWAEIRNSFSGIDLSHGNAKQWWWYAKENGLHTGQIPRLGAICCYGYPEGTDGDWAGHVSVVEVMQKNQTTGEIIIETSNSFYNGDYFYYDNSGLSSANNYTPTYVLNHPNAQFLGFIYIDIDFINISIPVISAILGNWQVESGINPGVWESLKDPVTDLGAPDRWTYQFAIVDGVGTGGFGLGQWTNVNTPNGRLYNLHQYCVDNNYPDGDGYGQLGFFLYENLWMRKPDQRTSAKTLEEFLGLSSASVEDLTWDFYRCWEGIDNGTYDTRKNNALSIQTYIIAHMLDDPEDFQWIARNNYLTQDETLNNAMVVYFWLTANYEPTPIKTKKGMPVWMMLDYYFDM